MNPQTLIDNMHSGNTEAILSGISSKNDLVVMNAILAGAKYGIKKKQFIDGVVKAQNSKTIILGYPIASIAVAATHHIEGKAYTGSDLTVKTLIDSKFNI